MTIGENQIKLINLAKNYLSKLSSSKVDVAESTFCWLLNLPTAPGYYVLKNLQKKKIISISGLFLILKQFIGISILHNFKLLNKINLEENFDKLIISWAKKSDFEINGSYTDRYLKINSRYRPRTMWFLLYLEDKIPKSIDNNILIFGKANLKKKYNFFYIIKVFFNNIKKSKGSFTRVLHMSSRSSHFAKIVSDTVIEIVKLKNFKSVLIIYEAQPFQNTIFKKIKKINSNINLAGYLHTTQPLPLFCMHRSGSPDLLLVHGSSQIFHLKEYFDWPSNKLRLVPSLRYQKKVAEKYSSNLILPYSLSFGKILINQFKTFLNKIEKKSIKPLVIRNHPFMTESKVHKRFIRDLENVLLEYNDRFSDKAKKSISVFLGGTSSILEALESGLTVTHICGDLVFESYSKSIWPAIKVKSIDRNILEYSLNCYGKCINFGSEDKIFEKYFNF